MAETEHSNNFGKFIRDNRKQAGMSLRVLADRSGVSYAQIIRWESGTTENPWPTSVSKISKALGVDPRDAVVALGFMTRDEAYGSAPIPNPMVREVTAVFTDPGIPMEWKRRMVMTMRFMRSTWR